MVQINRRTKIDYLFGGLFNENRGLFKREKRRQDSAKKKLFLKVSYTIQRRNAKLNRMV